MKSVGIRVPKVPYYAQRAEGRATQAMLLVPELVGYQSLTSILTTPNRPEHSGHAIASAIGELAHKLHQEVKWLHQNFYPKHLFIKIDSDHIDVCLIDLENARPLRRKRDILKDLGTLFRRAKGTGG